MPIASARSGAVDDPVGGSARRISLERRLIAVADRPRGSRPDDQPDTAREFVVAGELIER